MRVINFEDGYTSSSAPTVDQEASGVSVTPSGDLSSTNVQAALVELQGDIDVAEAAHAAHVADVANPHAVTKTQVGLGNVLNVEQVPASEKAQADGVATLDSGGRIPMAQLPDVIVGAVHYLGTWNATTNTPTIVDSTGSMGGYYVVAVAGSTAIDGISEWKVGDWIIFNGTDWEKIDNTEPIASVNGYTGVVVLAKGDVGLGNVDDTSDATKNAASATLALKTLDKPVIDDYVDFNTESTPSAPGASKLRVWAGTDGKLYTRDSAGTIVQVGAGGSGEINMCETGTQDATGWTAESNMAVATTTTAAQCPLSPIVDTAIRVTRSSGTNSVYRDFDVPAALMDRKHKIEFHGLPDSGYASGDLKLVLKSFTDQARTTSSQTYVLSTDVSSVTAIPNFTGKFTTTFDADTRVYYRLYITGVAGTTPYNLTNLVVGPGIQPQGAVLGVWESVPTTGIINGSTTDPTLSTGSVWTKREGDSMRVRIDATWTNGNKGSGTYFIQTPSGLTLDTSKLGSFALLGYGAVYDTSGTEEHPALAHYNNSRIEIIYGTGTNFSNFTDGAPSGASSRSLYLDLLLPVAEWSGNGTVNLSQNNVEYAFNTSVSDADDTTSFGYGSGGTILPGSALTSRRDKTVRFSTPIQSGDTVELEIQTNSGGAWSPVSAALVSQINVSPYTVQNGVHYGLGIKAGSTSTDVIVSFGQYSYPSGATYGAAGNAWSSTTDNGKWRLKKVSGGTAVGFGLATSDSAGLVNPYNVGSGVVYSGTYIPTATASTGVTAVSSVEQHNYIRVGKIVYVTGWCTLQLAGGSVDVDFSITLPVATASFASSSDLTGVGTLSRSASGHKEAGFISGSGTSALFRVESSAAGATTGYNAFYSFSYEIQ